MEVTIIIFCASVAGSGALVAIFMRTGFIQFTYSDADKQSMGYKMSQTVAEMELIQKRGFSDSYYDGLGVKPPKKKEPDDKPAA